MAAVGFETVFGANGPFVLVLKRVQPTRREARTTSAMVRLMTCVLAGLEFHRELCSCGPHPSMSLGTDSQTHSQRSETLSGQKATTNSANGTILWMGNGGKRRTCAVRNDVTAVE
jgi:hypothetical protein